jgi:MFS transporter, Spinster family, sphingosine-1-phosphate transporter
MKESSNRRYLLAILIIILAFNSLDRLALGLLLQTIKTALLLSDTQLGFLSGIAFALFYSVFGIPIARWADRGNRVVIISLTTALWSAAVALCGTAGSFVHLLLIRIGVAVGEAGCVPPAHSLIADHFSRAERPRAMARYMLGLPLSSLVGYFLAGWLNEFFGWRATFVILGLPGLALAAIARLTLTEPRCRHMQSVGLAPGRPAVVPDRSSRLPFGQVFRTLWSNVTFRHLLMSLSVMGFFSSGIQKWLPAFFIRSHGLHTGELGTWLALMYGIVGIAGSYCGGELATRLAANNERLQLRGTAVMYSCFAVLSAMVYLVSSAGAAFCCLGVAAFGANMAGGPLFATLQSVVPAQMRAMSVAIIYLFTNLIGMGLGPLAVGVLSDVLHPAYGEESLRYALLILCPGYLWGAWHLLRASSHVIRDLEAAANSEHARATEGRLLHAVRET